MTTTYNFEFENDAKMIYVHFVDHQKSIDAAEALAQIGHADRRGWARRIISKMMNSGLQVMQMSFSTTTECPFEKRLNDENWISPTVALMTCDTHQKLCVYRL